MIKDKIDNIHQYDNLHKNFRSIFNIIESLNFNVLEEGHIELDGNYVYININRLKGKSKEEALLETHDKYIDIHIPINTQETIGYKDRKSCNNVSIQYNEGKDITFYNDTPDIYLDVKKGEFVIFFPEDAHAPAISDNNILKMVIKVSVKPNSERPTL